MTRLATLTRAATASRAATATRAATASRTALPAPTTGMYGCAIAMDSLNNMIIGGPNAYKGAYRFRAEFSDVLDSIIVYWYFGGGTAYGKGTGGSIDITLQGVDGNGLPDGTAIATIHRGAPPSTLETIAFPTPPTLVAGTRYCIVFENVDADPVNNYTSNDSPFYYVPDALNAQAQPGLPYAEWAGLIHSGSTWSIAYSNYGVLTPTLGLNWHRGTQQGMGYRGGAGTDYHAPVNGTNSMAREVITVGSGAPREGSGTDRLVTGVYVRVRRTSGTDPLIVRLELADGTEIESVSLPAASIPVSVWATNWDTVYSPWVGASFLTPHLLVHGQVYHVRLSTAAGTTYTVPSNRRGRSPGGLYVPTVFDDGVFQNTTNGSTWANYGEVTGECNMQMYLVTTT